MLVSVIVPVYNMRNRLPHALDSVLTQSLVDLEVVCIDDGSTDGSLDLLRGYSVRDGRVVVLAQENSGPGFARNAGMKAARGKYIFFLDPDDLLPDTFVLENLYRAAEAAGALVVGGNVLRAGDDGRAWGIDARRLFAAEGWMRFSQTEDCFGYWRYLYNREALIDNGVFFPSYRRGQDPVFLTRLMGVVDDFYAITEPVYTYQCGSGHVKWTAEKARDHYRAFEDILSFSAGRGYRYMHSAAASRVMNEELLMFTFGNANGVSDPVLLALNRAVDDIKPALLISGGSYDGFVRNYRTSLDLLAEGSSACMSELAKKMANECRRVRIRRNLVAMARCVAPGLLWKLQMSRSAPLGNYSVF